MTAADELAIRTLIARYCHACDDGDAPAVAALFAKDAKYAVGDRITNGRDDIEAHFVEVAPVASIGKHLTTNTAVTFTSETDASALSDWAYLIQDNGLVPLAAGRYKDTFTKAGGDWLIARREIVVFGAPA